jgi:hypothetical protein
MAIINRTTKIIWENPKFFLGKSKNLVHNYGDQKRFGH